LFIWFCGPIRLVWAEPAKRAAGQANGPALVLRALTAAPDASAWPAEGAVALWHQ